MRLARALAALAVAGATAFPGTARAQSGERITAYDVVITMERSGRIRVVESIDYSFGDARKHGIFRHIPVRFPYDDENDRVYPLHDVSAVLGVKPVEFSVSTENGRKVVKIGDPDRTVTGEQHYEISYTVDGAVNRFESHDELFWNAIGTEWGIVVQRATVRVEADVPIENVACHAGPEGSRFGCGSAGSQGLRATFSHGVLRPFEGLSVVAAVPRGYAAAPGPILEERWSLDKAFARSPAALGLAGLVLLLGVGGVALLVRRTGRDRQWAGLTPGLEPPIGTTVADEPVPAFGRGEVSVEYTPGDDMRPALMGVLLDESADPLDVTATIVDLAVRRHLTITELPRKGLFRKRDWQLDRLAAPGDDLAPWEATLLAALFAGGDTVRASLLKNEFHTHLKQIQGQLYDDVVARGWFTRRPDSVRGRWHAAGIAAVVTGGLVTFALARFTSFGLVGVAAVVAGIVLLAFHRRMPFRTARGTAALDRARAFRRYLVTAEANQLRFEEQQGIFARYLPYAVVLGETERWARAFRDLDAQELYWYSGPHGWSAMDFGDSISSFSTVTAGTLASTPSSATGGSGFSGGSGGGGGGGGGGSW